MAEKNLVIVESPAKAKTIQKYLGKGYDVIASMGHVRDLPENRLSVDVKKHFQPKYTVIKGKEKLVEERRNTEEEISRILKTECASYTRKCTICGRELSWDYPSSICERCFERGKRVHPRRR